MRTQNSEVGKQSRARNLPVEAGQARNKNRSPGRKLTKPREVAEPPERSGATAESADWEMEGRDPESAKRNVVGLR